MASTDTFYNYVEPKWTVIRCGEWSKRFQCSLARWVLGWTPADTDAQRLAKLQATLSAYKFATSDTLQLFAALLSLPLDPEQYPPLDLPPQKLRLDTLSLKIGSQ